MHTRNFVAPLAAAVLVLTGLASAQTSTSPQTKLVQPRITAAIDGNTRVTLPGSRPGLAQAVNDIGAVPGDMPIAGITLVFSRSAAQQAALTALIAAQQDPASLQFHQWLTPAQFGAQFGMADADLSVAQSWLQSQGLTVTGISPSRDRIIVSGTATQVAAAFGTPLHYYRGASAADAEAHYAPAADLALPAALAATVLSVDNLSSFRPRSHLRLQPAFTSNQSGNHFLLPGDVSVIYDINAAYSSGYTGSGVSIAVVGQSAIVSSDITNFQTLAGVPVRAPTAILVPGSGSSVLSSGNQAEADLDLEYTSSIAKGANIFFIYTGSNTNYGAFDALNYAVQQNIAQVISVSFGNCELAIGSANIASLEAIAAQAATQGQTVVASSGDFGSTDCQQVTSLTSAQQQSLAVDYPAASAYVTGIGGTEFPAADTVSTNSTYFTAASGFDVITSAKSYIPEVAWNDDTASSTSLSSGGGGSSLYTGRPSWQTGTIGGVAFPSGTYRLVPDVSLDASNTDAPYAFCSSDTTALASGQSSSCTSGFRDSASQDLTLAGGTSFSAPIFAGMVALIVQAKGGSGLGLLNPTLYTLAANSATYAGAFHDITGGSNACTGPSSICTGAGASTNFAATTGYDEATGLGSVDLNNLLKALLVSSPATKSASKVTLVPASSTPAVGVADTLTLTVASNGSTTATPTGTVVLTVDAGSSPVATLTLVNGSATYSYSPSASGTHVVTAVYSGDANYNKSSATVSLTAGGTFTLSAGNVTVKSGSMGSSTVTITPAQGYIGSVAFTASAGAALTSACYSINNGNSVAVTSTAPVSTTLTFYTNSVTCSTVVANGVQAYRLGGNGGHAQLLWTPPPTPAPSRAPLLAGLCGAALLLTLLRRRQLSARMAATLSLGMLLVLGMGLGLGLTGCSSGTAAVVQSTGSNTPVGTYTVTLTGTDTSGSTLSASTTLTLTVD